MQPILSYNGGVALADTISATVTEQRNGAYTANFTYPYVGKYFSQINYDSVVLMKANQKNEPQKFRISSISKPINGIVSYGCEHISYDLNKNPVLNASAFSDTEGDIVEGTAEDVLRLILIDTTIPVPYSGKSDITDIKQCQLDFMSAREAIFKLQQYYGGELEWDNYRVILHQSRGVDNGAIISYGVNLLDYTQKLDVSNVYTAIVPYMKIAKNDGNKQAYTLPEKYLTYPNANQYAYIRAKSIDFTDDFTEEELSENKSKDSIVNLLRNKAQNYVFDNYYNAETFAFQNVTLSYVDLRKAKEFEAIETMNDLGLCDWVTLKDDRLGVNFKGQVISTKFNVITEMYDSIEIGNPTDQLLDTLASIVNFNSNTTVGETVEEIEKNLDEYFSEINIMGDQILFTSGNIKNIEGVYNKYKYIIYRDTDIQEEGKKGKIIAFVDPKNRRTKITRE